MQEDISLIDLVIELVDARVPLSAGIRILTSWQKTKAETDPSEQGGSGGCEADRRLESLFFRQKGFGVVALDSQYRNAMKGDRYGRAGGLQGKGGERQKKGNQEPSHPRDGGRNPQCGKIHLYHQLCGRPVPKQAIALE